MKKLILLFATSLFFQGIAQVDRSVQPKPGPAPVIQVKEPQQYKLKNGLTVMLVENRKLPQVSATLSLDNPPILEGIKAGLSQLTSSLLGKGSKKIEKDDFYDEVDFMGGNIAIGTSGAYAQSLTRYFERTFQMMADAALNPKFTDEEFIKERDVIIDGLKSSEKDVTTAARRVERLLAYGGNHPFGEYTTSGTINNIKLEDIQRFYDFRFRPNNAYLVVVGDINMETIKPLVKKYFGKWKPSPVASSPLPKVSNPIRTQIDFVNMPNAVQSEVVIQSTTSLTKKDPDYFPVIIANSILGGGGEARLFLNLREDKGYTYGAYSSIGYNKRTATRFRATASVRNEVTDSSVVELLNEIKKIRTYLVSESELRKAKAKYVGNFVRSIENSSTIATFAYEILTEDLDRDFYKKYLDKINAVTAKDVLAVAKKYFNVDQARVIVTGKGVDVLDNLENVRFNNNVLSVNYYNKYGSSIDRPRKVAVGDGVSASGILTNYIDKTGVKDVSDLSSIKLVYKGSFMQNSFKLEETYSNEDQKQVISVGGNAIMTSVVTDESAYMMQGANQMDLPKVIHDDLKKTLAIIPEIGILATDEATLEGIENINGDDAYVIKVLGTGVSYTYYFNVETGLKVKESSLVNFNGQMQTNNTNYSNYIEMSGLMLPGTKTLNLNGQEISLTLGEAILKNDE
jgi:predicted Zn-dependent peptidase